MALGEYVVPKKARDMSHDEAKKLRPEKPADKANTWHAQDAFFKHVNNVLTKLEAVDFGEDKNKNKKRGKGGIIGLRDNDFYGDIGLSITCWAEIQLASAKDKNKTLSKRWITDSEENNNEWSKLEEIATAEGLKIGRHDNKTENNWIVLWAAQVTEDEKADKVTYKGDALDAAGTVEGGNSIMGGTSPSSPLMAAYWVFGNLVDSETTWNVLQGEKQFAGSTAIFDSFKSVVSSSMRSFASTPDGGIRVWWPDKWDEGEGQLIETIEISDMELVNLTAETSMEDVYTHVYCRGGWGLTTQTESTTDAYAWEQTTGLVFLGMLGLSDQDLAVSNVKKELDEAAAKAIDTSTKEKIALAQQSYAQYTTSGSSAIGTIINTTEILKLVSQSDSKKESVSDFKKDLNNRLLKSNLAKTKADAAWAAVAKQKQEAAKQAQAEAANVVSSVLTYAQQVAKENEQRIKDEKKAKENKNDIHYRNWIHLENLNMSIEQFYEVYGMRPKKVNNNSIAYNSIQPFLVCLDEFLKGFASIYKVKCETTFMPEVRPGMRIKLKSYDVSWYVDSVSHQMNYTGGFNTQINCSCPTGTMFDAMVNIKSTDETITLSDSDYVTRS